MNAKPDAWFDEVLAPTRVPAPPGLKERVLQRLPRPAPRPWLPQPRHWWLPALSGAAATLLLVADWHHWNRSQSLVVVHFELHAPGAHQVELLGSFNGWQPGAIRLNGPDASGHWTATVSLPEGRYEYQFLVDGRQWVTDPLAPVVRPDGFGRVNAIRNVAKGGPVL
jgi:hypothetical protein